MLVSTAAVAAVVAVVLLALLVAAALTRRSAGPVAGYGLGAFTTAVFAVGLLVLARAGALARTDPARARALCARCSAGALLAVVAACAGGALIAFATRSAAPAWGGVGGGILLLALIGLAAAQRSVTPQAPRSRSGRRSGGGGESEPDRAAGAR
jgi:hypothetical protein